MSVKIGHASIDERGKVRGGSAGDQTKKEVCTRSWYNKGWNKVIRPKDPAVAEKIAKTMEEACANDKIGYDQYQRTTLYTKAKAKNWDLSKITEKCECDCSSLVAVCVNASGITVNKDIYTGNEADVLKATGKFTIFTEAKYTDRADYLKRGDILLKEGSHTAVVLSDGSETVSYYPKFTNTSIVSGLKSIGVDSSFAMRKKIAEANGITNYTGSYTQNVKLLALAKKGQLKRV